MNFLHSTGGMDQPSSIIRYIETFPSFTSNWAIRCVGCLKYIKSSKHRCFPSELKPGVHERCCIQQCETTVLVEIVAKRNVAKIVGNSWYGLLCFEHEYLKEPVILKTPSLRLIDNSQLLGFAKKQDDTLARNAVNLIVFKHVGSYTKMDFINNKPIGLLISDNIYSVKNEKLPNFNNRNDVIDRCNSNVDDSRC